MASNSKQSKPNETKFTEAEKNWNLDKLYEDLREAKQGGGSGKRKVLTETEKCHLRGLLCGKSPEEIANERGVVVGTVNDALSKTLYCYIQEQLNYTKEIRHWGDVRDLLEKAGYKIPAFDQSQPNHPLPDKKENTLEASHKIEANSIRECFSKSIDQLGNDKLYVRIGAIYALEKIAKDSVTEHWIIMEYLAAFVRTNAPRKEEEEGEEERSLKLPEDIQAALTVIGRRDPEKDPENQRLDLSNIDIRGAILIKANLQRAILSKANLQGTDLREAKLQGADLTKAKLQRAKLWGAELEKANLQEANLERAVLNGAELQGARLDRANLTYAYLWYVKLQQARLDNTILEGAILKEAQLQGAILDGANLKGAFFNRADLEGVSLEVADLKGADLFEARNLKSWQIARAFGDNTTVLPNDVPRPAHWI